MFDIQNRRYTGSKYKLMDWISELIRENCPNCRSFFDVFAGTGCVTEYMFEKYDRFIVNDFLYSNNIIYNGFFLNEEFNESKLLEYKEKITILKLTKLKIIMYLIILETNFLVIMMQRKLDIYVRTLKKSIKKTI